jgi:uncharacterized protein DUF4157
MQRRVGNQATGQLLGVGWKDGALVQAKLVVGPPGDIYEQEADRVADQILQGPQPAQTLLGIGQTNLQRKCVACSSGTDGCSSCAEEQVIQPKPIASAGQQQTGREISGTELAGVDRLRSGGQPLSKEEREFFEPRLGHDLGDVRIHANGPAADSARLLRAHAYTTANHVVFAAGQYSPQSPTGRRLLAHELVHTLQQRGGIPAGVVRRQPEGPGTDPQTFGGGNFARLSDIPSEKWSDQIEYEYRKRGDDTRADAIRACRLQGGAACASLLTNKEVEALYALGQAARGDEAKISAGIAGIGLRLGPPLLVKLVVRIVSDLLDRAKFQSELRKQGFIILDEPLGLCIGGCHLPSRPRSGRMLDIFPPPRRLDPADLEKWLGPSQKPAPPPATPQKNLDFFHGTRWSIAKQIPKNVKPIGGGDFAAGFYTHHDADGAKALRRALDWGRRMAKQKPAEPYAGIVRFGVPGDEYQKLFTRNKAKVFDLKRSDQPDFKEKQKAWLDFITTTGRKKEPVFKEKREQWVHERREPQPNLDYNIVAGPFYSPLRGTKDVKPKPEEFKPFAEGKDLPQQVTWAKDGITLLNSDKVETELMQYDAKTGKRKDPPDTTTAVPTQPLNIEQMTEEAQLGLGQ